MTTPTHATIAAGAHATKSLSTLARLLTRAGLDEMLQGEGRYTLFAPTDGAFASLPPGVLQELESDPAQLRAVLEYHIICPDRELGQIRDGKLTTLEGTLLTASLTDDGVRLDDANTSGYPLHCGNGVIHQIDAVLFPGAPPASARLQAESPWSGKRKAARTWNNTAASAPATPAEAAEALFEPRPTSPPQAPSTS